MPIQRQSEAFGIFDDGPRFARDRASTDLPRGLAGLINSTGPRIQAGLLNTRQAGWHTPDYDPRVDGYASDYGDRPSRADFAEEDAENERRRNYPRGQGAPWDYDKYGDPDPDLESLENTADPQRFISGNRQASRHPFDRAAARRLAKDGECTCWEGYERVPGTKPCASGSCRKKSSFMRHLEGRRVALAPAPADPAAMAPQMPVGGGFLPAHRVGLDWRDRTVPGTVIGVDDQVHIRWDDGQYTSEHPDEVRLL